MQAAQLECSVFSSFSVLFSHHVNFHGTDVNIIHLLCSIRPIRWDFLSKSFRYLLRISLKSPSMASIAMWHTKKPEFVDTECYLNVFRLYLIFSTSSSACFCVVMWLSDCGRPIDTCLCRQKNLLFYIQKFVGFVSQHSAKWNLIHGISEMLQR